MSDLLYFAYMNSTLVPDAGKINALIAKMQNLTDIQKNMMSLNGADSSYYRALCAYMQHVLADNTPADSVATKLKDAGQKYIEYCLFENDETKKTEFIALIEQIKTEYAALSQADKDYLADAYNFYLGLYTELTTEE